MRRRFTGILLAAALAATGCTRPGTDSTAGRVQAFTYENHAALVADVEAGGGPALDTAMDLAGVNGATREILLLRLQSELPLYRASPRAMALAIRSHGTASPFESAAPGPPGRT